MLSIWMSTVCIQVNKNIKKKAYIVLERRQDRDHVQHMVHVYIGSVLILMSQSLHVVAGTPRDNGNVL